MKQFLIMILTTVALYPYLLSDKLPKETTQLIESFECFTKDDRTIIYAYVLAHKYRMDHINDREALVKGDLDYWRLWHLVSDMEYKCKLNYQFSHVIEETILQTEEDRKIHKRLARLEGSIRTDGTSESSARMSKYDKKLRQRILDNPPKYTVLNKFQNMEDYDLKPLKNYKPYTIPKNIYEQIENKKITSDQKDILFRDAYLVEEMIRAYDKPKLRHKLYQEILYLDECKKMDGYYLRMDFYPNFKRKLSRRVVTSGSGYYPLKTEFLPKEVESYCENNITKMKLSTFIPKQEIKSKKKVKKIVAKLENLQKFLSRYDKDTTKNKYANEYLSLMKKLLESPSRGTPNVESLKLLRLKNCLVADNDKDDFALIMARVKDFRLEGLKKTFYTNIFNSHRWWHMTIRMKIDAEGESYKMKHFFDCNQTLIALQNTSSIKNKSLKKKKKIAFNAKQRRDAYWLNDEVLKNYAAIFENKPTTIIDNRKAIEVGLISKKNIDENGNIKIYFGDKFLISGMPNGGINLTYHGIPKGKTCTDFIQSHSLNNTISFNNKTYEGLDYIIINKHKIKLNHYVYKYVEKLCSEQDNNTISFIRDKMIIKKSYTRKSLDSAFSKVEKLKSIDEHTHSPNSATHIKGKESFVVIGSKAKLYDANMETMVKTLPSIFQNSYNVAFSADGRFLAVGRYGTTIHIWDMQKNKIFKTIKKGIGGVKMFLSDNKTLILVDKQVNFLDIESEEIVGTINPKFMLENKKYNSARISVIVESPDSKSLYIAGNKKIIEHWSIEKSFFDSSINIKYIDRVKGEKIREVGALAFDTYNDDVLIIASKNLKIKFWNIKKNILEKTYIADEYMGSKKIVLSKDNKNMLVLGTHGAFLWKLNQKEQYDIIKGSQVLDGMFMKDPSKFILMSREIDIWKIKNK